MEPGLRWLFRIAAGLALVAGILLFVLATETEDYFSWTIEPPLSAAFMGAAYWAACVLLVWAARQSSWANARTALPPVLCIAVLLLAATLIHIDRFDLDSLFGVFWLVVYVVVTPLLALLLVRQLRRSGAVPAPDRPIPDWLRGVLALQAVVMLGLGVALFAAPAGVDSLWPWTLTPLTARAIGAFLIGFGAAAAFACWDNGLARLHGAALAYAALGALELLAVALHSEDLTGSTQECSIYVAFLIGVLGAGLYGSVAGRPSPSGSS